MELRLDERARQAIISGARLRGKFEIEVFNNAREMKLISKRECHNTLTAEGLNHILNVILHGATQITTWYCLLFETDTTPSDTTTYATPVFTETSAYAESTRPEYQEANSTAKSTTNSGNKAVFTANATKTFYGAALVGGGTNPTGKVDKTSGGTMPCAGKFGTPQPVISGNVVNLTYTMTAADAG